MNKKNTRSCTFHFPCMSLLIPRKVIMRQYTSIQMSLFTGIVLGINKNNFAKLRMRRGGITVIHTSPFFQSSKTKPGTDISKWVTILLTVVVSLFSLSFQEQLLLDRILLEYTSWRACVMRTEPSSKWLKMRSSPSSLFKQKYLQTPQLHLSINITVWKIRECHQK